jgi:hypothetical protein
LSYVWKSSKKLPIDGAVVRLAKEENRNSLHGAKTQSFKEKASRQEASTAEKASQEENPTG